MNQRPESIPLEGNTRPTARNGNDNHDDSHSRAIGSAVDQHHPLPVGRCGPKGQQRPSGPADGRCADGLCAVDAVSPAQSGQSAMVQSGPVRPVGRTRLDAALQPAASDRLRSAAGANQTIPPVGQHHARASRTRRDAGRGNDHRSAGPGIRQRRRHGDRGSASGGALQSARATRSSITTPTGWSATAI